VKLHKRRRATRNLVMSFITIMKRDQVCCVKIGYEHSWVDLNQLPVISLIYIYIYINEALILKHMAEQGRFRQILGKVEKRGKMLEIDQIGPQPEKILTSFIVIIP